MSGTKSVAVSGPRRRKKVLKNFVGDLEQGSLPTEMADWRLTRQSSGGRNSGSRARPRTLRTQRYRLQHLRRIIGNKRLKELTVTDLDNYVTARLGAGLGAHSINKEVRLWSQILGKAKLWKRRFADDLKPLKAKASDIGRALTPDELRQLAEIAATALDWEAAFYGSVLAANTGLRSGEMKKLRLGMIDLESRRLRITRASTKTDAGARHRTKRRRARRLLRACCCEPQS